MSNQKRYISRDIHAGIIDFTENTQLTDIIKAARILSEPDIIHHVLIRRTSKNRWGIELILTCNSVCENRNIDPEIRYWLSKIKNVIPTENIYRLDISGEVMLIKPGSL